MKILVVDDSSSNRSLLASYVAHLDAEAITVSDGASALRAFVEMRPDLVLLDVVLPDIDGFEVARSMRREESDGEWTPIIFLSAMTADENIETGIAAGGDDYLTKPVSEVILAAKVRAMQRLVQARKSLLLLTRKLDSANRELQRLSSLDGLTGIANRRYFDEYCQHEWQRAQRNGSSLAMLMCDVDYFKPYNDRYGHQAGDDCLRQIAGSLAGIAERPADLAARYGGEEFAIIMPETEIGGAYMVAEKLRQSIWQLNIAHTGVDHGRITLSAGVAALLPRRGNSAEALIGLADKALYQAKKNGRDCVCRAETEGEN